MKARFGWVIALAIVSTAACDKGNKADDEKAKSADDDQASDDDGASKKKKGNKKKKKKKKKKSEDDETSDETSAGEAPVSCGPPSTIPDIPSERSNPPTLAEWGNACDVNTQGAGSQAADCTMKIKREWLQLTCRGKVSGYEQFDGFGNEGQDYFQQIRQGEMASFVVRLRKGRSQKVRICRGNERASLFVSWPPSSPKPTIVALAAGPACDGSGFGAK